MTETTGTDIYALSHELLKALNDFKPETSEDDKIDVVIKSLAFTIARILNIHYIDNESFMKAFSEDVINLIPIAAIFDNPVIEQIRNEDNENTAN